MTETGTMDLRDPDGSKFHVVTRVSDFQPSVFMVHKEVREQIGYLILQPGADL